MKKLIVLMLISCFVVTGCGKVANKEVQDITVAEVKEIVDNKKKYPDTVIIDVRTEKEFLLKHIKGSILIPLDEIETIDIPKDKKIILYCQSGNRSGKAGLILLEMGYKDVYNMIGGTNYWIYEFSAGEQ